jgi:hypothetical protein
MKIGPTSEQVGNRFDQMVKLLVRNEPGHDRNRRMRRTEYVALRQGINPIGHYMNRASEA